jgi:hypothetical protein
MRVLLAFLLIVTIGAMWESSRGRTMRARPLLVLCTVVAALFFGVERLL